MVLIATIRINSVKSSDRVQPVRRVRKSLADDCKTARTELGDLPPNGGLPDLRASFTNSACPLYCLRKDGGAS